MKSTFFFATALIIWLCHFGQFTSVSASNFKAKSIAGWPSTEWNQPDIDFAKERKKIDTLFTQSSDAWKTAFGNYKSDSKKHPKDAKKLFSWAYISWVIAVKHPSFFVKDLIDIEPDIDTRRELLADVSLVFGRSRVVSSYNYVRLKFLYEAMRDPRQPFLYALGKRLVQRDPQDYEVMARHFDTFSVEKDEDRKVVLSYAERILKAFPREASAHAFYGGAMLFDFEATKSNSTRKEAIKHYKKYLELAHPEDPFRSDAEAWIEYLDSSTKSK